MFAAAALPSSTMARWQLDSGLLLSTPYPAAVLSLPPGLDIHSTLSPPTFRVSVMYQRDIGIVLSRHYTSHIQLASLYTVVGFYYYYFFFVQVWPPVPVTEDVILLAEFSEIEGPVPLLSIPQSPTQNLDLNEFVVKVLSTDYLNTR